MMRSFIAKFFPTPSYLHLPCFGLDISVRAVKYIELQNKGSVLDINKWGEREIEKGIVEGGVIKDPDKLTEIIRDIKKETDFNFAYISLPEEKAYLVEMTVPTGADADLHEAIELHLEEQIPIDARTAIFDYEIVHAPDSEHSRTYVVMVSAVESALAESYQNVLAKSGVISLGFEFESQAIARSVVERGNNGISMIVDIGREQSNVSIVSRSLVRLTSSITVGGNAIAEAITKDLGLSIDEAIKLKEEEGLMRRGAKSPFESIVRVASVLRDEMYKRLIYWNTGRERSNPKDAVSEIILCGGNGSIPGLTEYLTAGIDLPVSLANPWVNILSFDEKIPVITRRESLKYCTALGLALRGVFRN